MRIWRGERQLQAIDRLPLHREQGVLARVRYRLLGLLTLATVCAISSSAPVLNAQAGQVELHGSVTTAGGDPIPGATVGVNDQRFTTDAHGNWDGQVDAVGTYTQWAAAPGYAASGWYQLTTSASAPAARLTFPAFSTVLDSVFDPNPDYARFTNTTPPTIDSFVSNTGESRSQTLPADASSLTVTGTVGSRDGQPLVRGDAFVSHPDDSVEGHDVTVNGDAFSVTFPLSEGTGRYQVEINDTIGSAVIDVPLFVGVPYAVSPPLSPPDLSLSPQDSEQQARAELTTVRAVHGLNPLNVDDRLTRVAQDHLADMVGHNWICHCWTDGSDTLSHLKVAGVSVTLRPVPGPGNRTAAAIGEGLESGSTGANTIDDLFSSPGHRRDLLGDYTNVGVAAGQEQQVPLFVIEYAFEGQ
jgi:uncharacterized protein YkwD